MNTQIEFYNSKLSYEMDASDLWYALKQREDIVVIDTRQPLGFNNEHIPNAINIPHSEMNRARTTHLDTSKTYICYCDGIGCNASTKGALNMTKLGFKTKELIGGIAWWKRDGYPTDGKKSSKTSPKNCTC
jgi:rhodanese-related sulfurtransferase